MARLSKRDLARAKEIATHVASYDPDGPSLLDEAPRLLGALLETKIGMAWSLGQRGDDGLKIEVFAQTGLQHDGFGKLFDAFLADKTVGWTMFNPIRPEPAQRNVVLTIEDLARAGIPVDTIVKRSLFARAGIEHHDQMRVLLCDGPSLLGWVGAVQEIPFDARQKALFKHIVPSLRKRLLLERELETAGTFRAAFVAALEAIGAAAFLVSVEGAILESNVAGRAALARDPTLARGGLRDAIGGRGGFAVTRVKSRGSRDAFLVVRQSKTTGRDALEASAARAAVRFGLTPKQTQVLGLLAEGRSTKTMAALLKVAESTVVTHLTAIYDRAQVEGRSELVAMLWDLA